MSQTRRTLAHATLDAIRPTSIAMQHWVDESRVAAIIQHVRAVGMWDLPPVLVIESEGNGATILDGHHRCIAAARLLDGIDDHIDDGPPEMPERIPAYVVSVADYCRVLARHFGDETPTRLADLDEYICVDGKPYGRRED